MVVDIIAESTILKSDYLPKETISGADVLEACPPRFYQMYFPHAKIYWAYGDYVEKDSTEFKEFKQACALNGIGLIEVEQNNVQAIELEAKSFLEIQESEIDKYIKESEGTSKGTDALPDRIAVIKKSAMKFTKNLCDEYIHRLIYYGEASFNKRAIIDRGTQDISLLLIDKLLDINNIEFGERLKDFSEKYRKESKHDYDIALEVIKDLWTSQLDMDYPELQKDWEPVLKLEDRYRDHFLHQFQVFLLGCLIIDKLYQTTPINDFKTTTGSLIENAWLAASTYHDFNYPIERCESWITKFFEKNLHISDDKLKYLINLNIENVVVMDEFLSKIQSICNAIGIGLDDEILRFILGRAAIDKNHGALGALTFLKISKEKERLSSSAKNLVAASILLHEPRIWKYFCGVGESGGGDICYWESDFGCKNLMPKLDFKLNPLAFLLAFCDEAQE